MRFTLSYILPVFICLPAFSQSYHSRNPFDMSNKRSAFANDSTEKTNVPEGIYVWTINSRFGDRHQAVYDTIPHNFQNQNFTSGIHGEYNYTGNLGAPRISRLFYKQTYNMQQQPFMFDNPYDFFIKGFDQLLFTNTKSPFTNITYNSCGNKTNGEDHIKAQFSVNAGKRLGLGFIADYLYGRGFYDAQSTAHFNGTLYASYLNDQYEMHAAIRHLKLKNRENGGIQNDDYVNRPEIFPTKYGTADMPVNLERSWNKIDGNQIFLTHRYNIGFRRYRDAQGNLLKEGQLPLPPGTDSSDGSLRSDSTSAQKDSPNTPRIPRGVNPDEEQDNESKSDSVQITSEFIPVTSFVHTFCLNDRTRKFISNQRNNPDDPGYFSDFYLPGDSALDRVDHFNVENTFAMELREGFNKWMKMGIRLYAKHEYSTYTFKVPYEERLQTRTSFHENNFTLGAQLLKQQGKLFHYNILGEIRTTGTDWGEFNVEANADVNIPLRSDSLRVSLNGHIRNSRPAFFYRHYIGRNAYWNNDNLDKEFDAMVQASLQYKQTRLTATLQNFQNKIYFRETLTPFTTEEGFTNYRHAISVGQASKNAQLLALTLNQDFHWGVFHWDNELTYQTSTHKEVLPIPAFTGYTNMYLVFRIAKVLKTELGADLRYFTRYTAPAYSPIIGQYALQDPNHEVKLGNYPIINAYANFHLKRTRFYVMASHVNSSSGSGNPFLVPHYPINRLVFRLGISWNFVN